MKYTVLMTSGWQDDFWKINCEFVSKSEAETHAFNIKSSDPRDNTYNTKVVAGKGKNNGDGSWTFNNRGNKITAWLDF